MNKRKIAVVLLTILALLAMAVPAGATAPESKVFVAKLTGAGEVPPRDTPAQGMAIFMLNADGSLSYRLIAANIDNVFGAHIHCGDADDLAPVGVGLFAGSVASGPFDGVLAEGTITSPLAANACGWTSVWDVVNAILMGGAYVNVHTNDGVAPPNTGPGDFPGGEIRGQITEVGPTR